MYKFGYIPVSEHCSFAKIIPPPVSSFEGACNWHADCINVHQSCCLEIESDYLYHKPPPASFQSPPISSNFAQPLKRSGKTLPRPQSTAWSTLREGDVSHCKRQMVVTPDTDRFSDPYPYFLLIYPWSTDAYLYSQSCEIHRLGPNAFISMDWFPFMNCNSVKSLKLLHFAFIFLFRVVSLPYSSFKKMTCPTCYSSNANVRGWRYM